jgi:hypothetical protein
MPVKWGTGKDLSMSTGSKKLANFKNILTLTFLLDLFS